MMDWSSTRVSRRSLAPLAIGAVGSVTSFGLGDANAVAQTRESQQTKPVDQVRVRRGGVGLRAYDPDRAYNGYTLFAPFGPAPRTVYLIDMQGTQVHTWEMPYAPGLYGYLTPRGTLFYNGVVPNSAYPGRTAQAGVALEADWDGNILWEVRNPNHHHDGIRLNNGNILLVCYAVLPADLAARVQGGAQGTEHAWGMDGDYIQETTTDGRVVWEWHAWEHLDPSTTAFHGQWTRGRNGPIATGSPSGRTGTLP
jgi:hypothetical protein